jgi:hypothetical protein
MYRRVEYIGAIQDVTERRLSDEALGKVRSETHRAGLFIAAAKGVVVDCHRSNRPASNPGSVRKWATIPSIDALCRRTCPWHSGHRFKRLGSNSNA